MCVNFGAVASFVVIPTIKSRFGYGIALLVPTLFFCFAGNLFLSQKDKYVYPSHNPHGSSLFTTFRLCFWLLHNNLYSNTCVAKCFPCFAPGAVPLPRLVPTTTPDEEDATEVSSISASVTSRESSRSRSCSLSDDDSNSVVKVCDPLQDIQSPHVSPKSLENASLQTTDRFLAQQLADAARALNVIPILTMLP